MNINKIKSPNPKNISFKLIITIVLFLSSNLLPVKIVAESNLTEENNKQVQALPPLVGKELLRNASYVDTSDNKRIFTNITFSDSHLKAAFLGQNILTQNGTYATIPGVGAYAVVTIENGRDYLFRFTDNLNSLNSFIGAATPFTTIAGETYKVTLPYTNSIQNAKGGETQDIEWGIYDSNQGMIEKSKKAISSSETGSVTFHFKATTSVTYLTMGYKASSSFTNNGDIRYLAIRGASVISIKTIEEIFPDPNLALVIANKLDLQVSSGVNEQQLASIVDLVDANGKNIENLTGMEYLTQLKNANFSNNLIRNLGPLSGLINLKDLNLANNKISGISSLSTLTNLVKLELNSNFISDVRQLVGLVNLTNCNLSNQKIVLSPGTIKIPTIISVNNPDGSIPDLTWLYGTGTYENNKLTWSSPGDNKLTWNKTVLIGKATSIFSGQISQYTKGILVFNKVPDTISFQTTSISTDFQLIKRNESDWEMTVSSDIPERKWILTASIDKPMTKIGDPTKSLTNAIVYVDENRTVPLSQSPIKVFESNSVSNSIIPVSWEADKGILLKPDMSEVRIGTYTTTINWTLIDAP